MRAAALFAIILIACTLASANQAGEAVLPWPAYRPFHEWIAMRND